MSYDCQWDKYLPKFKSIHDNQPHGLQQWKFWNKTICNAKNKYDRITDWTTGFGLGTGT